MQSAQEETKLDEKKEEKEPEDLDIYWEKQGISRLCGLHTINSILQGPFYNAVSLSEIAKELDLKEQKIMAELGTETEDYIKFLAQDSVNVAEDGNFSIQVLTEAVTRVAEVEIAPFSAKKVLSGEVSINDEKAIIVNSHMHWFALRKVNGVWYDLNSTNKYPEILNDERWTDFLTNCVAFKYLLFTVNGNFPDAIADELNTKNAVHQGEMQIYFKESFLKSINESAEYQRQYDAEEAKKNDSSEKKKPASIDEKVFSMTDEDRIIAAMMASGMTHYLPHNIMPQYESPAHGMPHGSSAGSHAMAGANHPSGNQTGPGSGPGGNMPPAAAGMNPGPMGNNPSGGPGSAGPSGMMNSNQSMSNSSASLTKEQMIAQKFSVERPESIDTIKIKFLFPDTSNMTYVFPRNFQVQDLYDYVDYRTNNDMQNRYQLFIRVGIKSIGYPPSTVPLGEAGFVMGQEVEIRLMNFMSMW